MTSSIRQKETDLESHLTKIAQPYRCRRSFLSVGIWDETSRTIEIVHQHRSAAKFFVFMGTNKQSKVFLHPEEALFMMQCSVLQVTLPNGDASARIPLSFAEAYSLWFNRSDLRLIQLHVYQYLTRFGFILRRSRTMTTPMEVNQPKAIARRKANKRKRFDSLVEEEPRPITPTTDQVEKVFFPSTSSP